MTDEDKTTDDSAQDPSGSAAESSGEADTTAETPEPVRPRTKASRAKASRGADGSRPADEATADEPKPGKVSAAATAAKDGPRQISLTFTTAGLRKVLGVLVVIAVVVGVVLLGWGYYQQRERLDAFDDSKAASEQFVTKLVGTMTKDGVADMKNTLGPLSTGDFHKHLEQQQSDTAKAVDQLNLQDAQSTVKSVSVEKFDTDTARTSVLMEVSGKSALAPDGGKSLMLLWLDLRKENGQWLVSELSGAQAGIGQEQGAAQPSPAAPAPAPAPAPAG